MILEEMTPELKAKALSCQTPADLAALVDAEGVRLSDKQINAISDGEWNDRCNEYEDDDLC